ncbi:MAG: hypothetical protein ACOCP8_08900 [archaeon]
MTEKTTKKIIKTLKEISKKKDILKVYYFEKIQEGEKYWFADIMNNTINKSCNLNWTWTIISKAEIERDEYCNEEEMKGWQIVVDEKFSEKVLKESLNKWLKDKNIDLKVKIMDLDDVEEITGYPKFIINQD